MNKQCTKCIHSDTREIVFINKKIKVADKCNKRKRAYKKIGIVKCRKWEATQ